MAQGYDLQTVNHRMRKIAPAKTRDYSNLQIAYATASTVTVSWASMYIEGRDLGAFSNTLDITASGALGLDTGSKAVSTWYYIYAIASSDWQTVSAIFSASATAPTLPSGYTKYRRLTAVRNDAASNFVDFAHTDDEYVYTSLRNVLAGGTATTLTTVDFSGVMPAGLTNKLQSRLSLVNSSGAARNAQIHGYYNTSYKEIYRMNEGFQGTSTEALTITTNSQSVQYLVSGASCNLTIDIFGFWVKL
jgi:hypothetical protein